MNRIFLKNTSRPCQKTHFRRRPNFEKRERSFASDWCSPSENTRPAGLGVGAARGGRAGRAPQRAQINLIFRSVRPFGAPTLISRKINNSKLRIGMSVIDRRIRARPNPAACNNTRSATPFRHSSKFQSRETPIMETYWLWTESHGV